jgi:Coenzyme PQQ synthesis protein D (PqqD)
VTEVQGDPVGGRFRVDRDAVAQRVGEEIVLVHLTTDRMYVLNQTAARAWELLCAGHDALAVRHRMLQEFEVSPNQLADELDHLARWLQTERLITRDADQ